MLCMSQKGGPLEGDFLPNTQKARPGGRRKVPNVKKDNAYKLICKSSSFFRKMHKFFMIEVGISGFVCMHAVNSVFEPPNPPAYV